MAKTLMLALLLMPLLIMASVPLRGLWLLAMFAVLVLFYWQWGTQFQCLDNTESFTLTTKGQLHFVSPYRLVQLTGGLVSNKAILLRGTAEGSNSVFSRWVLADQCSDTQFRALARAVNQCSWQGRKD